ncbi:MAG: hypothetical protein GY940_10785, partial [bacterium]|nr:hypothetical protein [bacterium]
MGNGAHIIRQLDHSKFNACETDSVQSTTGFGEYNQEVLSSSQGKSKSGSKSGGDPKDGKKSGSIDMAADDGSTIDLLVVYTDGARSNAGGTSSIEAEIDLAISETNQGYLNSGVNHRVNLVHTAEVNYTESSSMA